jgi:hypothetical protein
LQSAARECLHLVLARSDLDKIVAGLLRPIPRPVPRDDDAIAILRWEHSAHPERRGVRFELSLPARRTHCMSASMMTVREAALPAIRFIGLVLWNYIPLRREFELMARITAAVRVSTPSFS